MPITTESGLPVRRLPVAMRRVATLFVLSVNVFLLGALSWYQIRHGQPLGHYVFAIVATVMGLLSLRWYLRDKAARDSILVEVLVATAFLTTLALEMTFAFARLR